MLDETGLELMRTSSNDIRRGNMGTHHPSKEQASSRTNKVGKEYVQHHIPEQKNKHLGLRKTKITDEIEQVRRRKWTWAGYEITDGHCASPPGNPTKGADLQEDRREKGTVFQMIAQDRQLWKQHAEVVKLPLLYFLYETLQC